MIDLDKARALLRIARLRRGLSIDAVALRLRISPTTVRNIETGRRSGQLKTLTRIADLYRFRLGDILNKCDVDEVSHYLNLSSDRRRDRFIVPLTGLDKTVPDRTPEIVRGLRKEGDS